MTRRARVLSAVAMLAVLAPGAGGAASAPVATADVLIRGGTVYTGSDAPFTGDVAVTGDRIVAVGAHLKVKAARVIDAKGMIVAPGFIDPHTHVEGDLSAGDPVKRLVPAFLMQGVTTAFIGNDGGGDLDTAGVLALADKGVGINYASYVGFGTIRDKVIGADRRAPTADELAKMKALVAASMCHGALGLSTGLFYAPQSFSKTDEVVALAQVAGAHGGYYDSHIRDESSYTVGLMAAIDEAIAIARDGHVPVHISHIKALGVDVQGKAGEVIARVAAARAAGLDITASQYPWSASGTSLVASLVPLWAQDGGRAAMLVRFDDASLSAKLHADMAENLRKRGGPDKLLISEGAYRNQTLAAVTAKLGVDPVDAAIAVIRIADPGTISFNQSEDDIAAFMRQPWVMTDSDASYGHPRVYGTYARKYAKYVVAEHVLSLRDFIERSTALPADWFHLEGRGHLRAGAYADVVVFDPATYEARATYELPTLPAAGVKAVLVNGQLAVDAGAMTGRAAGRALAHVPTPGSCPAA